MKIRFQLLIAAVLSLLACLTLTSTAAYADVYDLNAVVGLTTTSNGAGEFNPGYTGLTVTGTLDIDPTLGIEGGSIQVQGDPNIFSSFLGLPCASCFYYNNGFAEYGLLDLGSAPFSGGTIRLAADSYIDLSFLPVTNDAFALSGTLTDESGFISGGQGLGGSETPEPSFFGALILCLGSVLLVVRNRRVAAKARVPSGSR
jgi:hypothetical protein